MKYLLKMGIVILIGILLVAFLPNFLVKILPASWFGGGTTTQQTSQYYVVYPREIQKEVYGVYDAQNNLRAVYPDKNEADKNAESINGTVKTIPSMP
jgi:hypothetical protein